MRLILRLMVILLTLIELGRDMKLSQTAPIPMRTLYEIMKELKLYYSP